MVPAVVYDGEEPDVPVITVRDGVATLSSTVEHTRRAIETSRVVVRQHAPWHNLERAVVAVRVADWAFPARVPRTTVAIIVHDDSACPLDVARALGVRGTITCV